MLQFRDSNSLCLCRLKAFLTGWKASSKHISCVQWVKYTTKDWNNCLAVAEQWQMQLSPSLAHLCSLDPQGLPVCQDLHGGRVGNDAAVLVPGDDRGWDGIGLAVQGRWGAHSHVQHCHRRSPLGLDARGHWGRSSELVLHWFCWNNPKRQINFPIFSKP